MRDAASRFAGSTQSFGVSPSLARSRHAVLVCFSLLVVASLILPVVAADANTVHVHSSSFNLSPAGTPNSISVDKQTGNVYVLTATTGKVQKFDAAGNPVNFSALGTNVIETECESACRQVAVDNSGGPNQGVIYVSRNTLGGAGVAVFLPSGLQVSTINNSTKTTTGFCGVAIGATGGLYIAHPGFDGEFFEVSLIDRYKAPTSWQTKPGQTPALTGTLMPLGFNNPCRLAVDSTGNVYVIAGGGAAVKGALRRFKASAFGAPETGKTGQVSTTLDPSTSYAAVDLSSDDVYADRENSIARYDSTGGLVETFGGGPQLTNSVGVAVNSTNGTVYATNRASGNVSIYTTQTSPGTVTGPTHAGHEEATLTGDVDDLGAGSVLTCKFEWALSSSATFTNNTPCSPPAPLSGSTEVTANLPGLLPGGTSYKYRLVTTNANGAGVGLTKTFSTTTAPVINGVFTSNLTETSAVVNTRINPHGADTAYRVEYGPTADYGSKAPTPDGHIGSEFSLFEDQSATISLTGLSPGVVYHFRVVAESVEGIDTSVDQTFNFFPPSSCPNQLVRQETNSTHLPDCRAYELVSPEDAGNVVLFMGGGAASPSPYATSPPGFAFFGKWGAITGTDTPNSGADGYIATRTNTGWETSYVGIPGNSGLPSGGYAPIGSRDFSKFVSFFFESRLPYVWNPQGQLLERWPASFASIPGATETIGAWQPSPDFSHLAFSSNNVDFDPNEEGLTTAPGSAYDYDTATGEIELISRTPSGHIPQEPGNSGSTGEFIRFPGVNNDPTTARPALIYPAVSTDGSHILMSTASGSGSAVRLYMRINDLLAMDITDGHYVTYLGMAPNGERVYFTSADQITTDDTDTSVDLYAWNEEGDTIERLTIGSGSSGNSNSCGASWTSQCNVTAARGNPVSDNFFAADTGDAYFYSPERLDAEEKGVPGARNLYRYHGGQVSLVAVLKSENSGALTRTQVSPDGEHFAFVTNTKLAAYENEGLAMMYSYTPSTGRLLCVSCNPDGTAPTENVTASQTGLFMADDGRTFWSTGDSLVPQDTNGLADVYEFVDGRPQLISSGIAATDGRASNPNLRAAFGGVTADGVNAYFSTYDTLVAQDHNGAFLKIYDARTGGGFPRPAAITPCVAADECHGGGSAAPSLGTITSTADLGSNGNATPSKRKGKKRKHRKHRRQGHTGRQGIKRSGVGR